MSQTSEQMVPQDEDTQSGKYLTFMLDGESYGIEIRQVTEIIGIQPVTFVPEVPKYVKGIINLRGQVIPVIDMRLKFDKEPVEYNERTCIIVVEIGSVSIGLIVDSVSEVLNICPSDIVPPPDFKTGFQNRYIKGIGKKEKLVILLLDGDKIVTNDSEIIEK